MAKETYFTVGLAARLRGMTPRQRKAFKPKIPKPTYPKKIERAYAEWIMSVLRPVAELAQNRIEAALDRWTAEYKSDSLRTDGFADEWARLLAFLDEKQKDVFENQGNKFLATIRGFAYDANAYTQDGWLKFLEKTLGKGFYVDEPWLAPMVADWGTFNLRLVKSLTDEYIGKLNQQIVTSVTEGKTVDEIRRQIYHYNTGLTPEYKEKGASNWKWRSQLIARDQMGKLIGKIDKQRDIEAGIDMYEWLTLLDERVRPTDPRLARSKSVPNHRLMHGTINRWDNGGVLSRDGGKTWEPRPSNMAGAMPGSQIQCRCSSAPFFENLLDELKNEV